MLMLHSLQFTVECVKLMTYVLVGLSFILHLSHQSRIRSRYFCKIKFVPPTVRALAQIAMSFAYCESCVEESGGCGMLET